MKLKSFFLITLIILIGAFLRIYDVNWDQNFHLHPDERFLTMIGVKETLPKTILQYFDPSTSPLNPSVLGFSFYVYGAFPLTINFLLSILLHTQTYDIFTLQGRLLSALFDIFTIAVIYKIGYLFEQKFHFSGKIKFLSAFFYAITVLPIQLSHFFTVDIFLTFFITLSLYASLAFALEKKQRLLLLAAISLGFAIACKVNALAILPLEMFLLVYPFVKLKERKIQMKFFIYFLLYILCVYISVRIADPYLFQSGNFFNPQISTQFIQSVKTLEAYSSPHIWYPPGVQWANKLPVIFSLINITLFGLGVGIFIFCITGIVLLYRSKKIVLIALVSWVILFSLYQSVQYVKTMRYFIFLYPSFAIFAGIGFSLVVEMKKKLLIIISIIVIALWPLAFFSVYTKPHTRVAATDWIYTHIPSGSTILGEYWDDPLPLTNERNGISYTIHLLPVFDPDTSVKWTKINNELQNADYLILSSNRGWGSIPTDPQGYPTMSKWYASLFAGTLGYKKIAEFSSFPSLSYLGIPLTIPDTVAEEAFTVYDHPQVMIFKRELIH